MAELDDHALTDEERATQRAVAVARHFLAVGRPERVLETLDAAAATAGDAWELRSDALYDLGRYADAAGAAERGLESSGPSASLLDRLALARMAQGVPRLALPAIEAARELDPTNALLMCHQAGALALLRKHKQAVLLADEAVALAPDDPDVVKDRLVLAAMMKDMDSAQSFAERLLELDPESAIAHALLAEAHGIKSRPDAARRHLEQAVRLDPRHAWLAGAIGRTWEASHPLMLPARLLTGPHKYWWRAGGLLFCVFAGLSGEVAGGIVEAAVFVIVASAIVIAYLRWRMVRRLSRQLR